MGSLLNRPTITADTLTPWPFQQTAIDNVRNEFLKGIRRTCVIMPTGTGKTVVAAKVMRHTVDKGNRVLFVVHLDELAQQTADKVERVGILPGMEKASSYARSIYDPDVVITSVQTMKGNRLKTWDPTYFNLLIYDECHHAIAGNDSYQAIRSHFRKAREIGLTGTPDRADEERISDVYQSVAFEMNLFDAMLAPDPGPYLCRMIVEPVRDVVDVRKLRKGKEDFNLADMRDRIAASVEKIANVIHQRIGDRKCLAYAPDVASAQGIATALSGDRNNPGLGRRADWVSGDDPDRAMKIQRYKQGDLQILSSCDLLLEGFDDPATSMIALARFTNSRARMAQILGRGLRDKRKIPDCPQNCIVLDFGGNTDVHGLVRPADLFDSMCMDPEVMEIVNRIVNRSSSVDLIEAIHQAQEKKKQLQVLRIKAREREVRYRKVSYDPVAVAETLGVVLRGKTDAVEDPPTPAQCDYARGIGIVDPEQMSRRRLSRVLEEVARRKQMGLATHKQIAALVKNGIDLDAARAMTKAEASEELDRILGSRPKPEIFAWDRPKQAAESELPPNSVAF